MLGLDIDNAVTLRLLYYDREQQDANRKMLAYEVCKMAFGEPDKSQPSPRRRKR